MSVALSVAFTVYSIHIGKSMFRLLLSLSEIRRCSIFDFMLRQNFKIIYIYMYTHTCIYKYIYKSAARHWVTDHNAHYPAPSPCPPITHPHTHSSSCIWSNSALTGTFFTIRVTACMNSLIQVMFLFVSIQYYL